MYEDQLPLGFKAASFKCGLKNNAYDLALIVSEPYSEVAALYTKNNFKAAPVVYSKKNDKNKIHALIVNSKNANALTGEKGYKDVLETVKTASEALECKKENILVASTGIMGVPLEVEKVTDGIREASKLLNPYTGHIAEAIQTRDKYEKTYSTTLDIDSHTGHFFAMAKGTSIVHPNLATVLIFIFTDLNIDKNAMNKAFKEAIGKTINRVSIDAETSTNDTAIFFANGATKNKMITEKTKKTYGALKIKLEEICSHLAKLIVMDGEGATKNITINVKKAKTQKDAFETAKKIATSNLVKISFISNEVNYVKILSALGNTNINISKLTLYINDILIFEKGEVKENIDLKALKESMKQRENNILVDLGFNTNYGDYYYFSDISKEYISIHTSYSI